MKLVELLGGWYPMCFNCAGQIQKLEPLPPTLAALREAVSRERRRVERRTGKPDTRVFRYERRVGDRRGIALGGDRIEDDMIVEVVLDAEPELGNDRDRDRDDVTRIRAFAG